MVTFARDASHPAGLFAGLDSVKQKSGYSHNPFLQSLNK